MSGLKERARQQPVLMTVIMLLFALSCIFCPTDFLGKSENAVFLGTALVRFVFAGLGIFFMVAFGFIKLLTVRLKNLHAFDVLLAALLVVLNNFPFLPLGQGTVTVFADGLGWFLYVLQCLSVGVFEETFFRGLIFMLLLILFPDTKKGQLAAIAVSSAVFGLTHLANLFAGAPVAAVLAQIGYSAAIGAMLAAVLLFGRTLWAPVLLHALFDVGGLMVDSLGSGTLWTVPNIVLTAVIGVCAAVYFSLRFALSKKREMPVSLLPKSDVENHHDQKTDNAPDDR